MLAIVLMPEFYNHNIEHVNLHIYGDEWDKEFYDERGICTILHFYKRSRLPIT